MTTFAEFYWKWLFVRYSRIGSGLDHSGSCIRGMLSSSRKILRNMPHPRQIAAARLRFGYAFAPLHQPAHKQTLRAGQDVPVLFQAP